MHSSTLDDPRLQSVLRRLHALDSRRPWRFVPAVLPGLVDHLLGRETTAQAEARRFKKLAIGLGPEAGRLAYLTARAIGARRIVEFGTSFGISTLYFAAAVADNGGGRVIGSELDAAKVLAARRNVFAAGLADCVEIREGDARETLAEQDGPVDLVLLDGMKTLYLDVLAVVEPYLRQGAVVLADNIFMFKRALAPYVAHVGDAANGYQSVSLPIGSGLAFSVRQ